MQRIGSLLWSQVLMVMVVGSYGWTNPVPSGEDVDSMRRLMYYGVSPRRLQLNDYGRKPLGEEQASYEDFSGPLSLPASSVADFYNQLEKRVPGNHYNFGLGKRTRAYTFGLGKRLEQTWKNSGSSNTPAYRQERRSKIYSFGLGKRNGNPYYSDLLQEDYDDQQQQGVEKKSRQFAFGLGKREVDSSSHNNANNNTS